MDRNAEYHRVRAEVLQIVVKATDQKPSAAGDFVLGGMDGFVLSAIRFHGADAVLDHIHQLVGAARVPAICEKPQLKIVNGGKV